MSFVKSKNVFLATLVGATDEILQKGLWEFTESKYIKIRDVETT